MTTLAGELIPHRSGFRYPAINVGPPRQLVAQLTRTNTAFTRYGVRASVHNEQGEVVGTMGGWSMGFYGNDGRKVRAEARQWLKTLRADKRSRGWNVTWTIPR